MKLMPWLVNLPKWIVLGLRRVLKECSEKERERERNCWRSSQCSWKCGKKNLLWLNFILYAMDGGGRKNFSTNCSEKCTQWKARREELKKHTHRERKMERERQRGNSAWRCRQKIRTFWIFLLWSRWAAIDCATGGRGGVCVELRVKRQSSKNRKLGNTLSYSVFSPHLLLLMSLALLR